MTKAVLVSRKAEELKKGDLFVSAFVRKDNDYSDPITITEVEVDSKNVNIELENGYTVNVFIGMKVVVQELA